jgi:predicted O-methyltransferase YrrM
MFRPERRHFTLFVNLIRVTRSPVRMYHGVKLGRLAIRCGAMQKLSEVAPFLALVGRPRTIVEIGAGRGGMLAAFCAAAREDATIVCVDLEDGPYGGGANNAQLRSVANAKPPQKLHLVRGDSLDPVIRDRTATLTPNGVDVLFIDGDHTFDGVSGDFRMYSPRVVPGGIVAFHDILPHSTVPDCQVDRLWASLSGSKREIVAPRELLSGGTWGGIGILEVPQSDH